MKRHDIEQFLGWTLVAIGGDIIGDDDIPQRVRLCFQEPTTQRLVDVEIEAENDPGAGLTFVALPRQCLAYRSCS